MSQLRNKAVRKKTGHRRIVLTARVPDTEKLRLIRALYIMVYNDSTSLVPQSVELFHLLGDILEGKSIHELADNKLLNSLNFAKLHAVYVDLESPLP